MLLLWLSVTFSQPGRVWVTKGVLERANNNTANIAAIRAWMHEVDITSLHDYGEIPPEAWPPCIKAFSPVGVHLAEDGQAIVLNWGSGFGHWGLLIGPPTMELPPAFAEGCYVLPVKKGVFAWHDLQ